MKYSRLLFLFVALFFGSFVFNPLIQAKSNWISVKSKNFTLIGDAGEKDIRKVAVKLEQFRETVKMLFPKANLERPIPTLVFVFNSDQSFKPFKPRRDGKIMELVAGYFVEGRDNVYIALSTEERGADPYQIIFHEYHHFILDNNFDDPPLWLNEGLAEVYSMFKMNEDGDKFRLGMPIGRHIGTLRDRSLLPLKTLFSVNHNSKEYNESGKVGMFYAQSWIFVHYLMFGEAGKRQSQFTNFISRLNTGISIEENFQQSFQTDFNGMEKELRQYVSKYTFPVIDYSLTKELIFDQEMQTRQMSEAESEFQLGKLLLQLRQEKEAEKRLVKSIALDANFAPAQTWLGYLRMRQENYDEAEKLLAKAIELNPKDSITHALAGDLNAVRGKKEEAIRAYESAIAADVNSARNYVSLGSFYASIGNDAEAARAYSKALRLAPREPGYFLTSSHIHLRLRRGNAASLQAQTYLRQRGWDERSSPYAAINAYFGYRVDKKNSLASQILDITSKRLQPSVWAYSIIRFLRREISSDELLKLADDKDKQTEARAYIGFELALDGKTDEALPFYQWVKDNGNRNFTEYSLVLAELKRMENPKPETVNR